MNISRKNALDMESEEDAFFIEYPYGIVQRTGNRLFISDILCGLQEMKRGEFVPESILDILHED